MKQLLTNNHSTSPKQYLSNMFDATLENGELYIAHYIDDLAISTVEEESEANHILKCEMTWNKDNYASVNDVFDGVLAEIQKLVNTEELYTGEVKTGVNAKVVKTRINRVLRLLQLGAPEIIVNFEKCMLIESIAINEYAKTSEYIKK